MWETIHWQVFWFRPISINIFLVSAYLAEICNRSETSLVTPARNLQHSTDWNPQKIFISHVRIFAIESTKTTYGSRPVRSHLVCKIGHHKEYLHNTIFKVFLSNRDFKANYTPLLQLYYKRTGITINGTIFIVIQIKRVTECIAPRQFASSLSMAVHENTSPRIYPWILLWTVFRMWISYYVS